VSARSGWFTTALVIVGLPIIGATVALAVLDPNDYKPQVADAVRSATGRELTLGGPLRVAFSLWPTIEISDVKLANLPDGSRPDMVRIERIQAQLSLWNLLWRRVEVTRLTLIGPNILFEVVNGKPNWVFKPDADQGGARSISSRMPASLRVRDFRVRNGMITSRMPARTNVLGIRTLRLRHPADEGPLELAATFVYSDYQPFDLTAQAQPTMGLTGPWVTQLEFAAFDAKAEAKGTISIGGDYDLRIDATAPALEKLNALLPELKLPALHQTTVSTHLMNGPKTGDLPVIGTTALHIGSADLGNIMPGLKLGEVDVSLPTAGDLASIAGRGSLAGLRLSLDGTFGVPKYPDGRVIVPIDLTAQTQPASDAAGNGKLSLKGKLALRTGRFDGLDASVKLRARALADLRPATSRALPALNAVTFDGKLVIPPDVSSLALTGVNLSSREGDLAGEATIGLGSAIALKGKFQSNKLDADEVLKAFRTAPAAGVAPTADSHGTLISDSPLPWTALRGPAIDLRFTVSTMTFRQQIWHGLEAAMTLTNGRLDVSRFKLSLPAGPMEALLTVDGSTNAVPVSVTLRAPGIPLSLIAHYADLPDETSGSLRVDVRLQAAGRSPHELASSLSGPFNATMIGGKISNAALRKLASASLQALGIEVPAQGDTDIHCFGVVGSFDNGVGRLRTIAIASTYLELVGSGKVDLGDETAALKLQPMAQIAGSSVSVPVVVEGSLRSLQGRLDASGLDQVGLMIDALFGGDKPDTCTDAGLVAPRTASP
jgi:uncharacterized protein involved in outer membrane biogenesis